MAFPLLGLIQVGINAAQVLKVVKGGGVAAGGAAIYVAVKGYLPDLGDDGGALYTALFSTGLNFVRKLLLKYDIDITVKGAS